MFWESDRVSYKLVCLIKEDDWKCPSLCYGSKVIVLQLKCFAVIEVLQYLCRKEFS